jgi:DNA (cytosine-5)-methyltransferase 1
MLPDGRVITPDIRDAERLQGFDSDWTKPAENVARASLRWSLIGNAVTVPVAKWLGSRLRTSGSYEHDRDDELTNCKSWPKAARFDGTSRYRVNIGAFPTWKKRRPLVSFLEHPGRPLSARATRGFLERTERGTLRFVPGFRDRLRAHLSLLEMENLRSTVDPTRMLPIAAQ